VKNLKIMHGAEPFYLIGNRVGCLCLHGLNASPQEMAWLAQHMHRQGFSAHVPRLYGHGTSREHFRRVLWRDWYLSALDGYHLLRAHCDQIFVIGLSMGGLLALRLGAAEAVSGLVVLGAPLKLDVPLWLAHYLRYVWPAVLTTSPNDTPLDARIRALQAQRGEPVTGRVAYYQMSTAGLAELHKLQGEVKRSLPAVRVPTLLIYSKKDQTVPYKNLALVQAGLVNAQVETLTLEQSDHILTNDVECNAVFAAVEAFVKRIAQPERIER
jgi:carboxylesterase